MRASFIVRDDTLGAKWLINNIWYGGWIDRTEDDLADMQLLMSKLGAWSRGKLDLTLIEGVTTANLRPT